MYPGFSVESCGKASRPRATTGTATGILNRLLWCLQLLDEPGSAYSFRTMFGDFTVTDRWTKKQVHCIYQALIVAIATRHADAVDVKFLVDGKTVWVALPHPAWVEYKKRTGKMITDLSPFAKQRICAN